ncbi:hypothetical protein M9435_004332 [Picochlorum sp. BPE23]|nr:hypothetical protein M9435_004332 [Picochlorum sp. BPE23]
MVPFKEWIYTVIHLSVWAEVGVITRAYLQKFFVLGCGGTSWGPCLAGGVYFEVLPPNILGSFIIGMVATSSMVGLDEDKSIVFLGRNHPWQSNIPLQTGVRTGLCGSITTFSSWMLEVMTTCLDGNQWLTGIGQMVVGFSCAVVAFALGTQVAVLLHHHFSASPIEDEKIAYLEKEADYMFGLSSRESVGLSRELEEVEPDVPEIGRLSQSERRQSDYQRYRSQEYVHNDEEYEKNETVTEKKKTVWNAHAIDHCAAVLLVALTLGSCFGVAYETRHTWIRTIWLSIIFAPFGCILRWLLSKLNYKLANDWEWLPIGTLAANWTGAVLDFVLQSVLIRVAPGYWGSLIINAIETGFCGCLTTVSTLVAEIMKQAEQLPFSMRVYRYTLATFVGAFIFGLCFLGWAYWT